MTGAIFVMAISAYYMLRRQDLQFARSSFRLAAVFGMIATLMTIQMGDESGYLVTKDQPTKIAAMEAIWETHEAPAPLTLFAIPDEAAQTNHAQIDVPWLFGLMGTRSLSTEIPGIKELTAQAEQRIVNGQKAIGVLEQLRKDPANEQLREQFLAVRDDLGFGLLLKRYTNDVNAATPEMIKQAAADTIPSRCSGPSASWSAPVWPWPSSSSSASSIPSGMKSPRRPGTCASPCWPCRFPGSPAKPAGSSPNTAASPGPSTTSFRRISPSPLSPRVTSPVRFWASASSTPPCWSWRCG